MTIEKARFLCCLGSDKMNRLTLSFNFEAGFAQKPFKLCLEKNLVSKTCYIRWDVILHLASHWFIPQINLGQCMTHHQCLILPEWTFDNRVFQIAMAHHREQSFLMVGTAVEELLG